VPTHPAKIGAGVIADVERVLGDIRWTRRDVAAFLGSYLTEPKPNVIFTAPRRPLSEMAFSRAAQRNGVELAPASLMLYGGAAMFMNGERYGMEKAMATPLRRLADRRRLAGRRIPLQGTVATGFTVGICAGVYCLSKGRAG